ncbi:hypothetical protein [Algoriphagus pacificus]|uniref:NlpE N-terminal domain-containing protein n=1 Tax=Algoriphagus pacificus TaxID=2811234 RepID=A0ABS3CLW4_9BACT|nr:hypothetical protein [Algoriphagus pacificus]MBN7818089.1 hypothetical protein [Algoriphagus pacificus]
MKLFSKYSILITSFFFCLNCSQKSIDSSEITDVLESCKYCPTDYKYIFFIPSLGCVGCISDAEKFLQENVDNSEYLFVLEKVQSEKALNIRLGFNIKDKERVIYVNDRIKFLQNFSTPIIYDINSGEFVSFEGKS